MHDAERRQENPETKPMTEMQKRYHQHEIGDGFDDEEKEVQCLHHETLAPDVRPPAGAAIATANPLVNRPKQSNTGGVLQILQAIPFTAIL
ncbi:hypothetical protein [Rhizobium leguminosarum]|jgi:hypothetical protein|uniref:hypothetical protein n=1 Tax=Rhizobium leguminosarum TaxID=384 RepID=UPI0021BC1975|nr:hypothetical protein [Rhizobium leguminosarum]